MRLLCLSLFLGLLTTGFALAQKEDEAARAAALLKLARAVIGNEAKLQALNSLSLSGTVERQGLVAAGGPNAGHGGPGGTMSGEIQFDFLMPDKILKTETMSPMAGIEITRLQAINGNDVWNDTQNNAPGGNQMVVRIGGPGGASPEQQALATRIEMARFTLGLLLSAPSSFPVEYKFTGVAENPEGKKADVIQIKHDGQVVIGDLFLDQQTHEPWMLTYQGRKGGAMQVRREITGRPPSPEDLEKMQKEAQARAEAQPLVEYQLRFSEFKAESGLRFPHKITRTLGDEIVEEWEFNKFKINPALKADLFVKKK